MFSKRFNFLLILFKSLNARTISYHQHVLCLASVRKKFTKCLSNLCKYRNGIYCCFSMLASDGYRSLVVSCWLKSVDPEAPFLLMLHQEERSHWISTNASCCKRYTVYPKASSWPWLICIPPVWWQKWILWKTLVGISSLAMFSSFATVCFKCNVYLLC